MSIKSRYPGEHMTQDFPDAFVASHYRLNYGDLSGLDEQELCGHYFGTGLREGRIASPMALREVFITAVRERQRVLEIGPFCNPAISGPGVKYLDVLDANDLRARAVEMGMDPAGCPQAIDF